MRQRTDLYDVVINGEGLQFHRKFPAPDMVAQIRSTMAAWAAPYFGSATQADAGLAACYDQVFPHYVAAREAIRPIWKGLRPK